ncbi:hypothetical protein CJU89_4469 [Yarrowia sp. B02]|nr:hypothetical protein CJU89_4469 [Yarrowia sp. B02]
MDNSRVVRTKRSFYGSRASPYERPQSRSSVSQDDGHKSGLFSRVVGFFRPQKPDDAAHTPQRLSPASSPQNRPVSALYPVIDRSRTLEEPEIEENITETVYTASRTPPRQKRISLGPGKSPNQRLAEFFEQKGDAPLSDVETAGVLALINEAAGEDPGLAERLSPSQERSVRHSMSLASLAGRNETYGSPSKIPRRVEPAGFGGLKKSRSMASLGQRNSRVARSSLGGLGTARGRPSPIMSSPKRSSPRNTLSPGRIGESSSTPKEILSPISSPSVTDRPLSGVASTLLSLIDDDEDEVVAAEPAPAKEFVNPYAASPRRPERSSLQPAHSREKLMTPSPENKEPASPSKTPSQIISQSMPLEQQRERDSIKAQPQMKKFDKYKPARSSNLRDSFVADPKSPESKTLPKTAVSSSGSPESMPPTFTFGSKNNGFTSKLKSSSPSGDEDTDVKIGKDLASSAAIRSPSKPLYPEISKDKPVLPSTPKLAKAGIPSTPQSEAAKKFGRDFDFSTPLKGEAPKPLTPADKSKVDQFKRDFVF